ncbi:MAG: enoyl-CoA hydratase/isomerase family protein [Acidobacteria bacterium]|nr:MAG: enoyl-CoA hydratase/isomerase family protein [Acidobacteriota bacterium]
MPDAQPPNESVVLEIEHGEVRELRLNRPPANALSPDLISALTRSVKAAQQDRIRALVLSGRPGMFSAGLDIPLLLTLNRSDIAALWRDFYELLRTLSCSPVPIAAAITGHAPAGGTVLAIVCDWRIAAEGNWKIGLSEVQVGLQLPPVIYLALRRLVGTRQAERLGVRGLLLSPAEAAEVGLIDEVVPAERVVPGAITWCREMLSLPRGSMSITRQQARSNLVALFEKDLKPELEMVMANWCDDETQSVLRAVRERLAKKKR